MDSDVLFVGLSSAELFGLVLCHLPPNLPQPFGSTRTVELHRGRRDAHDAPCVEYEVYHVQVCLISLLCHVYLYSFVKLRNMF